MGRWCEHGRRNRAKREIGTARECTGKEEKAPWPHERRESFSFKIFLFCSVCFTHPCLADGAQVCNGLVKLGQRLLQRQEGCSSNLGVVRPVQWLAQLENALDDGQGLLKDELTLGS